MTNFERREWAVSGGRRPMSDVAVRRPGGGGHRGTRYHLPCLGGGGEV